MRSATAKTFSRLWLMTTTPRPRSRKVWMSWSTCSVCETPSAAVGSSSSTTLGSPSSERAMATACRCPPDIEPTSTRTSLIVVTASESSSASALCSIAVSSMK